MRIELDNPEGLFKPGMFATATFVSKGETPRVVIPNTSIFRLHDKDWVFIPLGGKKFRRVEVQLSHLNTDGSQQVLVGLQAGDNIVANALQLSAAASAENPLAFEEQEKRPHTP